MGCVQDKSSLSPPEATPARPVYKAPGETLMDVGDFSHVEFDPNIPLTKKQIYCLVKSWRGINREVQTVGVVMMSALIMSEPRVRQVYPKWANIKKLTELQAKEDLEEFSLKVMGEINEVIVNLDEYDYIHNRLVQLGRRHIKYIKDNPELFYLAKKPFLDAVRQTLGDRYTDNMHEIYIVIIDFILDRLVTGLKEEVADQKKLGFETPSIR